MTLSSNFCLRWMLILGLTMGSLSCAYNPAGNENSKESLPQNIDFETFVTVGDQFSSGFMDGALYASGQQSSFFNLLGTKIYGVGENGEFIQPSVTTELGSNAEIENAGKFYFEYPSSDFRYAYRKTESEEAYGTFSGTLTELNDYSFPNMGLDDIFYPDSLRNNELISRVGNPDQSLIDYINDSSPGVVVVSLGMESLIDFAINGASGNENAKADSLSDRDLLAVNEFEALFQQMLNDLKPSASTQIIITNYYNPLMAPYFTELSYFVETEFYPRDYVADLMSFYQQFNQNVMQYNVIENDLPYEQRRKIIGYDIENWPNIEPINGARVFYDEYTPTVYLNDGTEIPNIRMMERGEQLLYKVAEQLTPETGFSTRIPLTDEMVLSKPEIKIIEERVESYNAVVASLSKNNSNVHLFDLNALMIQIQEELYAVDGVSYSVNVDRYSIFSADGYSLNSRGNAVIAREMMRFINSEFGATLNLINPNKYPGTSFSMRQSVD